MSTSAIVGILRAILTADTAEFTRGIRTAADELKVFSKDMGSMGKQLSAIGTLLTTTVTLPIVAIGVAVGKASIDFESSFAGVRKTLDATEPEFAAIAQSFRNLAKEIPINVNELNRLGEAAGALGIPKAEVVDFARVMALLGVTTNVTSEQAAEGIAKIQNIFQSAGKETDRFAATLVALGNNGASTESQILELSTRIASAGNAVGLSQAQVLGFSSAIANVGIEAEAGGSAISRVFIDISQAVSKGGTDVAAFAKVAGLSMADFSRLFKTDAAAATTAFIEGLGQISKSGGDLNSTLTDLGFTEIRQSNLLRSLALSGDNLSKSLQTANKGWQDNSALTEEARKRFETTEAQMTLLWNRIKDVAITVGNALLPMIKAATAAVVDLIPYLESAAKWFADLPKGVQFAAVAFLGVVAAIGPLVFVAGQLISSIGLVAGAFGTGGIAIKAYGAATTLLGHVSKLLIIDVQALNVALTGTAAAMGVAVVAIAAVTAAVVIGYQAWQLYKERQEQAAMAANEAIQKINNVAEATRLLRLDTGDATASFASYGEAMKFLSERAGTLRAKQAEVTVTTQALAAAAQDGEAMTRQFTAELKQNQAVVDALTSSQRAHIEAALDMGKSSEKIAEGMKISEEAVKLFKTQLEQTQEATKKTGVVWAEYAELVAARSGTMREEQIRNIDIAAQKEIEQLDVRSKGYEEHKQAVIAKSDEMKRNLVTDWEFIRSASIGSLNETLEVALNTYKEMMTRSGDYTEATIAHVRDRVLALRAEKDGWGEVAGASRSALRNAIEDQQNLLRAMIVSGEFTRERIDQETLQLRELEDQYRHFGRVATDAQKAAADAAKKHTEALHEQLMETIRLVEEAGKLRGTVTFDVTKDTLSAALRGQGFQGNEGEQLASEGYSFPEILDILRGKPKRPPKGPRIPGYIEGGPTQEGMAMLHEGEYVVPRGGSLVMTDGSHGIRGGSTPIIINATFNDAFIDSPLAMEKYGERLWRVIERRLRTRGTQLG